MEKIKYCPKCKKQHPVSAAHCDCGYNFVMVNHNVDETVQTSNTKVIVDNVPLWIWSFLGFITCSICGWIFYGKYREDYPERSKSAKSGAIAFYIFEGSCLLIYVLYLILSKQGKIQ
ncbi:MAG: DUF4234 domain-containing protein [Bacilli bacterium]|nr:DUF4234 domain-containing protein [Bacilli bacterium]